MNKFYKLNITRIYNFKAAKFDRDMKVNIRKEAENRKQHSKDMESKEKLRDPSEHDEYQYLNQNQSKKRQTSMER